MTNATRPRRADEFPAWPEPESQQEVKSAMEELSESMRWLDANVTVHDSECPGGCGGQCLSEAEASREDEQ